MYTVTPKDGPDKRSTLSTLIISEDEEQDSLLRNKGSLLTHLSEYEDPYSDSELNYPTDYIDINYDNETYYSESLPEALKLYGAIAQNGTNIQSFSLHNALSNNTKAVGGTSLSNILYICLAVVVFILLAIGILLLGWRYYKLRRKKDDIVVVRSRKNEREETRRRESWGDKLTLNSESNLQTVKVKTLAITVRNNLEEEGTEV